MRIALAALALLAPAAAALDAFPTYDVLGETEARLLVRLPRGGTLAVEAAGAEAAVVEPGRAPDAWEPTPARFEVQPAPHNASWHGLSGTVEVQLRRGDAAAATTIVLREGDGPGYEVDWPAAARVELASVEPPAEPQVWVPALGALGAVAAVVGVALQRRARRP